MSYPIGTVCLIIGADNHYRLIGKECTTTSVLCTENKTTARGPERADGYWISLSDMPGEHFIDARYLIKLDPDQDFSGEDEEDSLDKSRNKVLVEY